MRPLVIMTMILVFFSIAAAPVLSDGEPGQDEVRPMAGTRLVFVEDVTATWCGYCPAASETLVTLSDERSDFRFITLIDDMVPDAASRSAEFKPSGYPSVLFDGGYEEEVGAPTSTDPYDDAVESCSVRDAPSLDVSVECFDEGSSRLRIDVEVTNNDGEDYSGRLLINVVEIVSRYLDADNNNYPYSLIGYADDESINIGSGNTFTTSATWIGSENTDLNGDDFSDIDTDNIVVYASVINSASSYKVRTSIPPSYFTAYYVDAVGEAFPEELSGAPVVTIRSPRNGRTVSREVEIEAEVASETDIEEVEVKIGQGLWEEMDTSSDKYTYKWDTMTSNNGPVKISVRATDRYDLSGMATIEVIVRNDDTPTPPEILSLVHSPAMVREGETVEVNAEVMAYGAFISGVELSYCVNDICELPVDMFLSGSSIYTLSIGPFDEGDMVEYKVEVIDSEGNKASSSPRTFTVQPAENVEEDDEIDPDGSQPEVDDSPPPLITTIISAVLIFALILKRGKFNLHLSPQE